MMIQALLCAVCFMIICGIGAGISGKHYSRASAIGVLGAVGGSGLGLVFACFTLMTNKEYALEVPWDLPAGSFNLTIDSLSAFFLIPLFIVSLLSAIYGIEYLEEYRGKKNCGISWLFYNILVASMTLVVIAGNAILFLLAWETMSLASYFLVIFNKENDDVNYAGWLYLIATHIGTAFLIVYFLILGHYAGSFNFIDFVNWHGTSYLAGILFILAVIGFGTKAGFIPFHIWLPYAHPAAPSHVSAVLSGVMIKMGIYGLVRSLQFIGMPQAWWGGLLIAIGIVSGIGGVLFALGQHDLKRLLAYHSVENIGIITCGLGLGILGIRFELPYLALFGFCGGLLHVVNHALFKSLLFLGAGAIGQATHTLSLDSLGGLLKKMPVTGMIFLTGSIAICGLPLFNGFISELFIYVGTFWGLQGTTGTTQFASIAVACSLAIIGALATACFTKAFGTVFLGEPRQGITGKDPGLLMRIPMIILAVLCFVIGGFFVWLIKFLLLPVSKVTGMPQTASIAVFNDASALLYGVLWGILLLISLIALLVLTRRMLLQRKIIRKACTWDCGYAAPGASMQYTASSFAQPIVDFFSLVLRGKKEIHLSKEYFPKQWSFHGIVPDLFLEYFYIPLFQSVERFLSRFRWLQSGSVQMYILYIAVALVVLIVWKFAWIK